jgi:heme-degrading monooxygenase HmoA
VPSLTSGNPFRNHTGNSGKIADIMVEIVWEFRVRPDRHREFEFNYDSNGAWAELFRKSSDYQGTILLRDSSQNERYLTIDRWTSEEAFRRFKQEDAAEYAAIDAKCEALTDSERLIGVFERI